MVSLEWVSLYLYNSKISHFLEVFKNYISRVPYTDLPSLNFISKKIVHNESILNWPLQKAFPDMNGFSFRRNLCFPQLYLRYHMSTIFFC